MCYNFLFNYAVLGIKEIPNVYLCSKFLLTVIVITDGMSNVNHEATLPEAELARKQDIHIFAIGVDIADDWELKAIASSPPENNVFRLKNWEDLWDISDKLIEGTCRGRFTVNKFRLYVTC